MEPDCNLNSFDDYKFLIQSVLIMVGWWLVHILTNRRDKRKLIKENTLKLIDEALSNLEELTKLGVDYHTKAREQDVEFKIKNKVQTFSKHLYALESFIGTSQSTEKCTDSIKKLRQALTGKHFEDEHLGVLTFSDNVLQNIADISSIFRQNLIDLKFAILKDAK